MSDAECRAVLLTGVYGSGKSTVAEELGSIFEERGLPYAALDLDWLGWFDAGWDDDVREHALMVRNLEAVVQNYLSAGVRYLVMALSVEHQWELDGIRSVVPSPLKILRLTVGIDTIESRLGASPTTGRQVDLEWARRWIDASTGEGLEDIALSNDRSPREVALDVLQHLGWVAGRAAD
ncbi:MAG TPA: hypothetical protein VMT27_08890 [Actinomycetes bacterium]|nr:hypothetical protein [Actinomycetes bacterium]